MTEDEITTASQTQFAEQEILYEKEGLPEAPKVAQPEVANAGISKRQKLIIAGVVGFLLLVFVILLLVLLGQRPASNGEDVLPTPTPKTTVTDPVMQRINDLQEELEVADPAKDALPLPPVDLELRLEKDDN